MCCDSSDSYMYKGAHPSKTFISLFKNVTDTKSYGHRVVNKQHIKQEIDNLASHKSSLTLVKQLRLFLDERHLLRCRGRIHNTPVDELNKFPILLRTNHTFTALIVLPIHGQQLHSCVNSTLTALPQKFWIPQDNYRGNYLENV